MKSRAALVVLALSIGCQRGEGGSSATAPASATYRDDIAKLCDVMARSGADKLPASDRMVLIAQWLGANLTTAEAHDFLVRIQPLQGEAHAKALESEASRVGLSGCALAALWHAPNAVAPM
ncbi:MAG TPA: hypothetical protein VGM88_19660 [Kofleriaceae bacterium]|jgi:hypothetical protein